MNKKISISTLFLLTACGCSGMNNTESGALGGGLIGTGVGAVVGGLARHPVVGALAGAAVGTGVGALAGNAEDKQERRAAQAYAARALNINDVVQLAHSGQSDDVIVNQIYTTGSVYQLAPADLNYLRDQRVSDRVIMYMQSRAPGMVGAAPTGAVIVGPPPPVAVGVGFVGGPYYGPYYRRHCW